MDTSRLEAFSDGVLAIIITIMVLEIVPPHGHDLSDWHNLIPKLVAYLFSFLVIAIYWNNHHHLLKAAKTISPGVMWANMHLLFWLSLVPVATAWVGEERNFLYTWPVAFYALVGLMAGLAYFLLSRHVVKANRDTEIAEKIGRDKKGAVSLILYIIGVMLAFVSPIAALIVIGSTAIIWFIPDRRLS